MGIMTKEILYNRFYSKGIDYYSACMDRSVITEPYRRKQKCQILS